MQTPTADRPDALQELEQKVAHAEEVKQINHRIHSAEDLDHILVNLKEEILKILDAEVLTLYVVDAERREIYSKYLDIDKIHEIRVPIGEQSIAGFVAKYRRPINLADAYSKAELNAVSPSLIFDSSWDRKSGLRTKQLLTYPILAENKYLMGVIQLVNKKSGGPFTKKDEESVAEISRTLGIAFFNQLKLSRKIPTKFDYLITQGKITQAELDLAIAEARKQQVDFETVLVEKYKILKSDIGKSLSQFYRCPFVEFDPRSLPEPDLITGLNLASLKDNFWTPLKREKGAIHVLIDDPNNLSRIQEIKCIFPGRSIQFAVGLRQDILQFIAAAAGEPDAGGEMGGPVGEPAAAEGPVAQEGVRAAADEGESAVAVLADQVLTEAARAGVSAIHVEPRGENQDCLIRFRTDGGCREHRRVPAAQRHALVAWYKTRARLDTVERRIPQQGKMKLVVDGREAELRVVTIPTSGSNEDVVMRFQATSRPIPIDALTLSERNLRELKGIIGKPHGILLCAGPAESGKTTTLHALLGQLNTLDRKIWTAEDPLEICQDGLRQVRVQPGVGFSFAAAVRTILSADPDVILIGEMHDRDTCQAGMEAALGGHLVLGAVRTPGAVQTVARLLDMGMDPYSVGDAVLGVLAQRLVRTICPECREAYHPSRAERDELASAYGEKAFEALGLGLGDTAVLYRGKGCDACQGSGFKGRTGLHELLIGTDRIKRAIRKREAEEELSTIALEEGMTTLQQDGIVKVIKGWTTFGQVKAATVA